jgi:membrane protease YdiL (CAAX protease family)
MINAPSPRAIPWILIAAATPLSEIAAQFLLGEQPPYLLAIRVAALAGAAFSTPFRTFSIIYAVELVLGRLLIGSMATDIHGGSGFVASQLRAFQFDFVFVALVLALAARLCGGRRAIYFQIGDLKAPIDLPGLKRVSWRFAAPAVGLASAAIALVYVVIEGSAVPNSLSIALWAVPFACANALLEESIYRSALIPALLPDFGAGTAVFVSAAIFGLGHWNGLPYGLPGVLLTFLLGAITAKAMVDSRGILWPWLIHMLPDCVMFYYWGLGTVAHH